METLRHRLGAAPDQVVLVRWASVTVAAIVTLVLTRDGVAVSPDSVRYLSGAESLADLRGVSSPTGEPLVLFPPGTSIVYAGAEITPTTTGLWIRLVNAACAGAAVWLVSSLLGRHLRHRSITIIATLFAVAPVGLLFVTRAAWSEPLFVVAVLAFVHSMSALALEPASTRRAMVSCASTVWMACLVRYAGFALIPVGALVVVAVGGDHRLRRTAEFTALAASVPVVMLVVNVLRAGSVAGDRAPGVETARAVVRLGIEVVGSWPLPVEVLSGRDGLRVVAGVVIGASLLVAVAVGFVRMWQCGSTTSGRVVIAGIAALTALANLAVVGLGQLRTALDPIDLRLVSPALLPTLIALAALVDLALDRSVLRRREAHWAIGAVAVALLLVQFAGARRYVADLRPERWFYTHPVWTTSEVAATLRSPELGGVIWTNDPFAVWALTDERDIVETPRSGAYRSRLAIDFPPVDELPDRCDPTTLVWFANAASFHYPPAAILDLVGPADRIDLADGTLWILPTPADCS